MMKRLFVCIGMLVAAPAVMSSDLHTEEIEYQANGQTLEGYLAYDKSIEGKRPGVLVVHEWWGHNDYARRRARMLAEMGYTGFALDMYGKGKLAEHPDKAGEMSSRVKKNKELMTRRFKAALNLLGEHQTTRQDDMAAIGYCFGGAVVLEMARAGIDLDGVASFHGTLGTDTPAKAGTVEASVLVLHGGADPFTSADQIQQFKEEMANAGVDYELITYGGAKHSFTNPDADEFGERFGLPLAYDKQADHRSWTRLEHFLEEVFSN